MTILAFISSIILYVVGVFADTWTSARGEFYGTRETTKFLTDAYGNIDIRRKMVLNIGVFAVFTCVFLWVDGWVGIAGLALFGGISLLYGVNNYHQQEANRRLQIKWLDKTKAFTPSESESIDRMHFETLGQLKQNRFGQWYYPLFRFIRDSAPEALRIRLIMQAHKPPSRWFERP